MRRLPSRPLPSPSRLAACALVLLAFAAPLSAHETGNDAAGAHAVVGLGRVDFPTSTRNPAAQAAFERGMLLLHVFEYTQAEQAFQDAEKRDPGFAMAYWGEAMTANHPVWNQQNLVQARAVLAKLGATPQARAARAGTARERAYLATLDVLYGDGPKIERDRAYAEAMAKLAADYPKDDEAQLFYALALLGRSEGERDVPTYLKAAAIAEAAYRRNPQHPGAAHYWIHGMDDPEHAAGALEAARTLARIAPDAGHSQHMTAHIFMALGLWDDVVAANENADRVVAEQMRAKGQPPYTCGHYAEWLEYGYFQQGRQRQGQQVVLDCAREGAATLDWMRAHPGTPVLSFKSPEGFRARYLGSLITLQATAIVESARYRDAAAAVPVDTAGLGPDAAWAGFAQGWAAAERGDAATARTQLVALQSLAQAPPESTDYSNLGAYLGVMAHTLEARMQAQAGHRDAALALARQAATDYAAIPFDFGPPVPVKPPQELLGELLLADGQPQAAVAAFDAALKLAPRRALSVLGRARALKAAGDADGARTAYAELLAMWAHADADLPELAEAKAGAAR